MKNVFKVKDIINSCFDTEVSSDLNTYGNFNEANIQGEK